MNLSREEELSENYLEVISLLHKILEKLKCEKEVIGTKQKAADYIDVSEQTITTLLTEGRIINYGRDRLYLFRKDELMDLREIRCKK